MTEENPLVRLWNLLDAQAWDALPEVLAEDVVVTYVHSGETFDRDGYVALNRDYPGRWRCRTDEVVVSGDRTVARVRNEEVTDDGERGDTYWVASFATTADGVITGLTEVWTSAVAPVTR